MSDAFDLVVIGAGASGDEVRGVVIAVGSVAKAPPLEGLADAGYWTDEEGTDAFPTTWRVLGGLFAKAATELRSS